MSQPLAVLFRDLLDSIYGQYDHLLNTSDSATPNIKDPLLGHNISWNWERSHFETFMRRIDDGRQRATKALELEEEDDRSDAVSLWQKVFGEEYFPSEVEDMVKQAALNALPGQAFVTSSGLVVSQKPASGQFTRTEGTTFHGETKQVEVFGPGKRMNSALQNLHVVSLFPDFSYYNRRGEAVWRGALQPREVSPQYDIEIRYKLTHSPKVKGDAAFPGRRLPTPIRRWEFVPLLAP